VVLGGVVPGGVVVSAGGVAGGVVVSLGGVVGVAGAGGGVVLAGVVVSLGLGTTVVSVFLQAPSMAAKTAAVRMIFGTLGIDFIG
jgi:hypothetical protein